MDHAFWHDMWTRDEQGFHQPRANKMMVTHWPALGLSPGAHVFVPLAGKSLDMTWMLSEGYRVTGAELSESAVAQYFEEHNVSPEIEEVGSLKRYSGPGIDLYAGDIFELSAAQLGPVDAIYDRAALVALPTGMREDYAALLHKITGGAPQLLICFEYDQSEMDGPPFSIEKAGVLSAHSARYTCAEIGRRELPVKLKGHVAAQEVVWHLS